MTRTDVDQRPVLLLGLAGMDILLEAPPTVDRHIVMANFCRALATQAARLAAEIDPCGEPRTHN